MSSFKSSILEGIQAYYKGERSIAYALHLFLLPILLQIKIKFLLIALVICHFFRIQKQKSGYYRNHFILNKGIFL